MSDLEPSLRISLPYKAAFLYPLSNPQAPSGDDNVVTSSSASTTIVRGAVLVEMPKNRVINALYITLTNICKLPGDEALRLKSEERTTGEMKEKLLPSNFDTTLAAGNHSFDFAFHLPATLEIAQHSIHGYCQHILRAYLEVSPFGLSNSASSIIQSEEEHLFPIALPNDPGYPPEPFNLSVEHHSHILGPIRLEVLSPYLTLSALVYLRLQVVDPPQSVSLRSIRASIHQTMVIQYSQSPSKIPTTIVEFFDLLPIDDSNPIPNLIDDRSGKVMITGRTELQQGKSITFEEMVQVQRCDGKLAVSSLRAGGTIFVTHKLVFQIRYAMKGVSMEKILTIEKPVVLASCVCITDSLHLPPYTQDPPNVPLKDTGKSHYGYCMCLCDYSLQELVGFWGEGLKGQHSEATEGGLERTVTIKEHRVDTGVEIEE